MNFPLNLLPELYQVLVNIMSSSFLPRFFTLLRRVHGFEQGIGKQSNKLLIDFQSNIIMVQCLRATFGLIAWY